MSEYYRDGRSGFIGNGLINKLYDRQITNTEINGDPWHNSHESKLQVYRPFKKIVNVDDVMMNVHADIEYVNSSLATKPVINYINGDINNLKKTNIDFMHDPDYIYGLAAEATRQPQASTDVFTRPISINKNFVNPQVKEQVPNLTGRVGEKATNSHIALYSRNAGGYQLLNKKSDNSFSQEVAPMFFTMRINDDIHNIPVTFNKNNVEAHVRGHEPLILNVTSDIKIVLKDVKSQMLKTEGKDSYLLTVKTPYLLRQRAGINVDPKAIKTNDFMMRAISDFNKGALTDYERINLDVNNEYIYERNIDKGNVDHFLREAKYIYPEIQKQMEAFIKRTMPDISHASLQEVEVKEFIINKFYNHLLKVNNNDFKNLLRKIKDPKYVIGKFSGLLSDIKIDINKNRIRKVKNQRVNAYGFTRIDGAVAPQHKNYDKKVYNNAFNIQYSRMRGTPNDVLVPQM